MAGLLLLLATLATLGSGHLADPGDSLGHYLARRQSILCASALSSWKYNDFKTCSGDTILIDGGNGAIDLSGWTDAELIEIFREKKLNGGFTIKGSSITGVGVTFETHLESDKDIIIENNSNLARFFLAIAHDTKAPRVRVSGNRLLNEESIEYLEEHLANGHIHVDSHIQTYQECDLGDQVVLDVAATLKNCKAIYGDLVFDASSKFPADMKSIEKLAYVQGCLKITGTRFKSWNELTFLEGTKSKKGGCKGKHEISGNSQMCIQPPVAETLKEIFSDMIITNNQKCTPECTSRHVLEKADSSCVIITDPLIIDGKTSEAGLDALENVEEIRGLLQVTNSSVENFKYLPKLTKLNSNNMSAGPVINLQYNTKMTHFDMPQLQASGVGTGRPGQIKFWRINNGPDGKFTPDAFVKRIGAEDSQVAITPAPTTVAPTTDAPVTKAEEMGLGDVIGYNIGLIIGAGVVPALLLVIIMVAIAIPFKCGVVALPIRWNSCPMKKMVEQTDIYQYSQEDEFMKQARKIVEENKPKIEAANQRHRDNRDYKQLSVLNHYASRTMPGYFQWKDYEQNEISKDRPKREWMDYRYAAPTRQGVRTDKLLIDHLTLPAQMNGLYGLAFESSLGGIYPKKITYRTQCDQYSLLWFEKELPPIYVEPFASTAKRMCHMPCDMISEKLRYLRNNSIKIPEYGITSKGFQTETSVFGKVHGSRKAEEKEEHIWIKDQIPIFKFYRYREKMNEGSNLRPKQYHLKHERNLHEYVIRMVQMMMSMPTGHVLKLKSKDVRHFLKVILPAIFGKPHRNTKYPRSRMSAGGYTVEMNRTHVRIVGELRGDFDALRRAINIPSLLDGKDHPMLQYNWLFLGNYTGRHPQSVETIMFLLALQFLYGRDCIVLLRGVMEFSDTSLEYGFKENLEKRFGQKDGQNLWTDFMKVFARLPLNCRLLHAVFCCSGGFNDGDFFTDIEDVKGKIKEATTLQSRTKIFSLPNYTVKDYFENVDTGAGYYYGERTLMTIAEITHMYTFFSTGPMTGGIGYFGDTAPVQLFMLSSVKGLHGHGGMVTQLAAVAELNGKTGRVTFHMMLEEDQMVYYDPLQMELRNKPFEDDEDGPRRRSKTTTTTSTTGTSTKKSTTPSGSKTASTSVV